MTGIPVLNALFAGEQEILEKKSIWVADVSPRQSLPLYFACNSNQTRSNFLSLHPQLIIFVSQGDLYSTHDISRFPPSSKYAPIYFKMSQISQSKTLTTTKDFDRLVIGDILSFFE